ncbi:phosphatase PAP2 family protein [Streptacidiphilus sp. 4-A2]|nr:phosphatase PAP2 family protein [Streptacidiphilus sp. 4-A2]
MPARRPARAPPEPAGSPCSRGTAGYTNGVDRHQQYLYRTYNQPGHIVITNALRVPDASGTPCNVEGVRSQRNEVALLERPQTTATKRPTDLDLRWPPLSRTHKVLIASASAFYLAVLLAVLTTSRLVALDWRVMEFKPYEHWPAFEQFLNIYVIAGQRGPSSIVVAIWLTWRCWRLRSWRPLLVMGVSLVLLNMSVGAVKIGMGRLGPHYAHVAGSSELFQGGGIFPSGHTANAVVTWGILAYVAIRWRRLGAVLAGFMGITVGLTTLYLGTHWVSDVLAGWAAGALVLLALPLFEPVIVSADARLRAAWTLRQGPFGWFRREPVLTWSPGGRLAGPAPALITVPAPAGARRAGGKSATKGTAKAGGKTPHAARSQQQGGQQKQQQGQGRAGARARGRPAGSPAPPP